jgi:hypothetical protein
LSVIAIRAALVYLLAGFTFGALLLANKGIPFNGWMWHLLPAHIEFLLVGWTAQLALGVSFWILPRFSGGSRGNVQLAAWAIGALNAGVLLVAAQSIWPGTSILAPAGRGAEIGAAVLFALHAWKRVRPTYSIGRAG